MTQRLFALASGLLLLAGCAMGPQGSVPGSGATLILNPELISSGYQVQVPELPYYTENDVHHVIVSLFTVANGTETAVTVAGEPETRTVLRDDLDDPVVFERLKAHTTYRAKCVAYMADHADPTTSIVISTEDAGSYTDIVVTNDDRPTVGSLKVRLKAKPFSGDRYIDVKVKPGGLTPEGAETISEPPLN